MRTPNKIMRRVHAKGAEYTAKFWFVLCALSLMFNFFLVLTLQQTAPQLQVLAQIVPQDTVTSKQLSVLEPFDAEMMEQGKIEEMLVRFYLNNRYQFIPDVTEMTRQWNSVLRSLSTASVFNEFDPPADLEKLDKATFTTSAFVRSLNRIDNTWTAEVEVYTRNMENGMVTLKIYDVVLETISDKSLAFVSRDFLNPFGLRVIAYRETLKK